MVDDDIEYELWEISDSKYNYRYWKTCELFYLVCWTGYKGTDQEHSWISAVNLTHTNKATEEYHERYPNKPGPNCFRPEHDTTVACHMKARKRCKEA